MSERRYNIRQVLAHPSVFDVKTAWKIKGSVGSEPLDTSVFTAGFTFQSRPGYLFLNCCFHQSPDSAGLIRHAQTADKFSQGRVRCRSPPFSVSISHFKKRNGGKTNGNNQSSGLLPVLYRRLLY